MTTPTRRAHAPAWVLAFLAAVLTVALGLLTAGPASAATGPAAQNAVGASSPAAQVAVGPSATITAGQRLGNDPPWPRIVVATGVAANTAARGGVGPVRVGQAGEAAVRSAYDIGPKATVEIGGRTRILDGLNAQAVSEVKNVSYQAYTQQLRDSLAYAQQNGLRFDLYVRGGANPTTLSAPLREAIASNPRFNLEFIP